jgi:hypothetical protein
LRIATGKERRASFSVKSEDEGENSNYGDQMSVETRTGLFYLLLSSSFCYTSGYNVGDNVSRLDDGEEQLAYLAQTANWI